MTQKLNAAGAKLRPRIKVVTQPAQTPDVNICDLAFFRALWPAPCGNVAVWPRRLAPRVRRAQHSLIWTSWLLIHMQPSTITHPRPWKRCGHTRQSSWTASLSQRVAMTMTVVARPKSARAESGPEGSRYSWRGRYSCDKKNTCVTSGTHGYSKHMKVLAHKSL